MTRSAPDLIENRNGSVVKLGGSGRIDHQTADAFQQALDAYLEVVRKAVTNLCWSVLMVPKKRLQGEGPPLCLLDEFEFPSNRMQKHPDNVLVVVTDGHTEAQKMAEDLFGIGRTDESWIGLLG